MEDDSITLSDSQGIFHLSPASDPAAEDRYLRNEALQLATRYASNRSTSAILEDAERYRRFLAGETITA